MNDSARTAEDTTATSLDLAVLRAVFSTIDEGILVVDQQSTFVMANARFMEIWNIPEEISTNNGAMMIYVLQQLVEPEYFVQTITAINADPLAVSRDEIAFLDGRTIERFTYPCIIRETAPWRVWIFRNVTSRKVAEAQIRQSERLASLGQVVAGAAHELNNPLTTVLGLTQLLLRDALPEQARDDLRSIEAAAQRAKHIVSQLLMFARQQQDEFASVDLAQLIDRVVHEFQRSLPTSIKVHVSLLPALPAVWGNAYQIEQVLHNLLHNAAQALSTFDQPHPSITIVADATESYIWLKVADNGPGIPPHILPRIFDPFFTTKDVGHGTGLGLSLVYGIINKHGGTVQVESLPGKGATFSIELPVSRKKVESVAPSIHPSVVTYRSILVVDDEEEACTILERALTDQGYDVDVVASGEAALILIGSKHYDLVISDLRMPGMGGDELFAQVHAQHPEIPWIFVTGDTMSDSSRAFLQQSGVLYLAKPFTLNELWEVVATSIVNEYQRGAQTPGHG